MSTYQFVNFTTNFEDVEVVTTHLFQERDLAFRGIVLILATRHERYFYFCKYRPVHWTGTRWKKIPFTVQYRPVPFTKYR